MRFNPVRRADQWAVMDRRTGDLITWPDTGMTRLPYEWNATERAAVLNAARIEADAFDCAAVLATYLEA